MNALLFATLLCLGAASANYYGHDDGQYRGEGLAESQDIGQYDHGYGSYGVLPYAAVSYAPALTYAVAPAIYSGHYAGAYAHGAAPLGHDGQVIDTPEVAHAKAAHFAAKAAATHGSYGSPALYSALAIPSVYGAHYAGAYAHGAAPLGHDGQVIDTPEVAHAKAAHFAAKAAATHGAHGVYAPLAYSSPIYGAYAAPAYYGAYAHGAAPLGHDGQVIDTPEVAHAKAAHFAAKAAASHGSHGIYGALAYGGSYGAYSHGGAPIGHDGRVVDTPEVAHAKAAHFAAKAAASHGEYAHYY